MSGPTPQQNTRLRLAICGGGIAGLSLACTLGRYTDPTDSIEVNLYEAGPEITTTGAGISVWDRTWQIMSLLGLKDELAKASVEPPVEGEKPGTTFRRSDRPEESYDFHTMMIPHGITTMHRKDLVDVLIRSLPSFCKIRTSKRLLTYTESSGADQGRDIIVLQFEDGTTEHADVLIGADGIRSATRAAMYSMRHARDCSPGVAREDCERCRHSTPSWMGTVAYRTLIPADELLKIRPNHRTLTKVLSWSGKGKHVVSYPVSHGQLINCVGFVTIPEGKGTTYPGKWVQDTSKEELLHQYEGWEPELLELLQCATTPSAWAIHIVQKLPFCISGQVALIGDAAHAMEPHFGAGAGQAIEDAYILGRLLAERRTNLSQTQSALKAYESVRLPFAKALVERAHTAGLMYEFNAPGYYDGSLDGADEKAALEELGKQIRDQWSWQWDTPSEADWNDALTRYQESLAASGTFSQERSKSESKSNA